MQGLILAAGMGKRLKDLTKGNTKCMVKVNGVSMIERALTQLDRLGLSRIVLVIGYEGQKLKDFVETLDIKTPIHYVINPIYDKTNNIYSLALAKDYLLKEDTLLLESDLIFEDSVLEAILDDPRETLALVDKYESWMDGTCIKIGEDDKIEEFVPGKKFKYEDINKYYKTVNIYKFSKDFAEHLYVPFLDAYSKALGNNEYYEQVLRVITMLDDPAIQAKRLDGQLWYEIDDIQDLDIASSMFACSDDEKLDHIQNRFGGYWRYPHLTDFCYLVNPYYPGQKLIDEMKASFETLLTQYPSGMRVNSLLAAKNFGVRPEHIVVGNGAAELIKSLLSCYQGKLGFVRPTFEEYPNRYNPKKSVFFYPETFDFSYTAQDLMDFFDGQDLEALVLINPDNPSGNYIPKADVLKLAEWSQKKGIDLIVDESFADFSEEKNATLIDEDIIEQYPHLIVVKSISKSYGVPGIRLGVLYTKDSKRIAELKKDVAIWNINSFGEFYLQIAEKYKKDYEDGLDKLISTRKALMEDLREIETLEVFPSQANYVMAELKGNITARELTRRLLCEKNLLIKDLTGKIQDENRQFIRLAVRNEKDNARLVAALHEMLDSSSDKAV